MKTLLPSIGYLMSIMLIFVSVLLFVIIALCYAVIVKVLVKYAYTEVVLTFIC